MALNNLWPSSGDFNFDGMGERMTAATMKERFDQAEEFKVWSLPDMTILSGGRRNPVPMPPDLFGPAWPLVSAIAEGTASPPDYAGIGLVAVAASLIGGKRRVRPYKSSAWSEPCILWCGAVGDPSTRKSPSLDAVTEPLRLIERDHADLHREKLREYQAESAYAKAARDDWHGHVKKAVKEGKAAPSLPPAANDPDEPSRRRTIVVDATPEAVGVILSGNPQGTLHFRDELAGWLQSFDRYSPGGREFWIEAYGGRPFVVDRKGSKEPLTIPFNGVSVLGGIQPAKLAGALLDSPDDGLTARFLWAWPEKIAFHRPQRLADMAALEAAYRRLDSLAWAQDAEGRQAPLVMPLSAAAADTFEQWQTENSGIDDDAASLFKSFVGKMDGAVLRLALIAELIGWAFSSDSDRKKFRSIAWSLPPVSWTTTQSQWRCGSMGMRPFHSVSAMPLCWPGTSASTASLRSTSATSSVARTSLIFLPCAMRRQWMRPLDTWSIAGGSLELRKQLHRVVLAATTWSTLRFTGAGNEWVASVRRKHSAEWGRGDNRDERDKSQCRAEFCPFCPFRPAKPCAPSARMARQHRSNRPLPRSRRLAYQPVAAAV